MALKCKNCGKINANNNKFCDECGGELERVNEPQKKKKGVLRYIAGIIVIVLGISAITYSNYVTGITLILTGLSLLPVVYDTLLSGLMGKNKFLGNLHIILPIVFFLSFVVLNPIDDKIREMRENKEKMAEYKEFSWPSSDIANLIDKPKSSKGKIIRESADGFSIEVSETSVKDYNDYVESCKEKGFTVDYSKGDDWYRAKNDGGYRLYLSYDEEDEVMDVTLDKPSEEKPTEVDKPVEPEKPSNNSTGVTTSVKEFLDSYESVVNEYVDFMKKYNASNNSASMLGDYMKMLKKYTDMADKASKMDQSEFTSEDLKYYLDVNNRISKKLLELGE